MNVNEISNNGFTLNTLMDKTNNVQDTGFKEIFSDLLAQTTELDNADKAGNLELVTGESDNTHDTLIEAEKADIALLLAVQIRNKVIDAYNEIMRMQF